MRVILLAVTWFNLVSALAGAVALGAGWLAAAGLPLSVLEGSVFPDFVGPAIILGVVVGGTQLAALVAYAVRLDLAWGLFAVAGFGLMIWIFIETGIIRGQSGLQLGYFATGLVQCVLVMLILGIWPRPFLARSARTLRGVADAPRTLDRT
jgi:hypothetical protein